MSQIPVTIILDDKRSEVAYAPTTWLSTSNSAWFNGTSQSASFTGSNLGQPGSLAIKFQGTSIAFFGTTPPAGNRQSASVSIDGSTPSDTSYEDPNPPNYRQWYQSPTLSDGTHAITLSNIANTSFDFATVTAGDSTVLTGQTIIVDNDDANVVYNGQWRRSQDPFNSGPLADGMAYHNTTHKSTTIGDSFTYRFSGVSAALYGIFSWSNIGLITLTLTLDGSPLSQDFRVNTDTPQFVSEVGDQQNFLFYSYDFLQSGDHTLTVNVTNLVNQTFSFDYITYSPSFSSLASMPSLAPISTTNATPDGGGGGKKSSSTGAIVGGVVGGIVVLALLAVGGLLLWRRRKAAISKKTKYDAEPFDGGQEISFIPQSQQLSPPPQTSSSFGNTIRTGYTSMYTDGAAVRTQPSLGQITHTTSSAAPYPLTSPAMATAPTESYRDEEADTPTHEGGGPLPPTYDESTGGAPVQVTYIIQPRR